MSGQCLPRWRGKFGWEYKTKDKHRDLAGAYQQLLQYRVALENPCPSRKLDPSGLSRFRCHSTRILLVGIHCRRPLRRRHLSRGH